MRLRLYLIFFFLSAVAPSLELTNSYTNCKYETSTQCKCCLEVTSVSYILKSLVMRSIYKDLAQISKPFQDMQIVLLPQLGLCI